VKLALKMWKTHLEITCSIPPHLVAVECKNTPCVSNLLHAQQQPCYTKSIFSSFQKWWKVKLENS